MSKHEEIYFKSNKELWNKKTAFHKDSAFYDLAKFKKGRNVLNDIELKGLGDVTGKSILHLQCHFGLDSMSWSRLGAQVTGVDFSDVAIDTAREICLDLQLDTKFICCDVYDLQKHLEEKFDIVFASYGVIGWLPDLNKWAEIISQFLKSGGIFYLVEFHPVVWMFDDEFTKMVYSYFNKGVLTIEQEGTYADPSADIKHLEYSWNHSLSEVVNALTSHGLSIQSLNEYDYSPYNCFANTIENGKGGFYIKGYEEVLPMVYSIKAIR
jgi:ubiquinone/menaquinone biosynthesis C-methylase UbiE